MSSTGSSDRGVPSFCICAVPGPSACCKNACRYSPLPAEGMSCSYQFRASASPPASALAQWRHWWWEWGGRSPRSWRLGTAGPPWDEPQSEEERVQGELKELSSPSSFCFFLWPFHYLTSLWSLALHNSVLWSAITWEILNEFILLTCATDRTSEFMGWLRVTIDQHETEKFNMVTLTRLKGQGAIACTINQRKFQFLKYVELSYYSWKILDKITLIH